MNICKQIGCSFLFAIVLTSAPTHAAEPQTQRKFAARVDDKPIYVDQVQHELALAFKGRKIEPAAQKIVEAEMLRQLIGRRLVVKYLTRKKRGASETDIDLAVSQFKKRLKQQSRTLKEYLLLSKQSEQEFRDQLAWKIAWSRYLERNLTDKNYQQYFNKHRRQYDGTQLRVAHLLLKVDSKAEQDALAATFQRAEAIREQIATDKITFSEAVQKHSTAPTAAKGGDIGLISRHEPMPESFSAAAFALQKDEVSSPIVTTFGVHLIRCLEIQPGKKTWQDVQQSLRPALMKYLFEWLTNQEREKAEIEFSPTVAHFKPGTRELVE